MSSPAASQLDYADYTDPASGTFDAAEFTAAVTDPDRTLLGPEQIAWLESGLADSAARWQVLGQQVLMGRMLIPAELLLSIGDGAASSSAIAELVPIKLRIAQGDPSVTDGERARIGNVASYNLDAWDGYAAERERVLGTAAALDRNLVVLSGDTHNGWANRLRTADGTQVGAEFATPAVTSPGIASFLGADIWRVSPISTRWPVRPPLVMSTPKSAVRAATRTACRMLCVTSAAAKLSPSSSMRASIWRVAVGSSAEQGSSIGSTSGSVAIDARSPRRSSPARDGAAGPRGRRGRSPSR